MTDEYVPTTEEILRGFVAPTYRTHPRQDGESFSSYLGRISIESMWSQQQSEAAARRWLADHDRAVAEKAWNEGHGTNCDGLMYSLDGCEDHNPYRKGGDDD